MKVWSDEHGDYDHEIFSPLFKDKDTAVATMALQEVKPGERFQLTEFNVV